MRTISGLAEEEATRIAVAPGSSSGDRLPSRSAGSATTCRGGSTRRAGTSSTPLARELYASLDVSRETLVHGDFHHHNILRLGARAVAIDPQPLLGEPEFDVPSFLWNPLCTGCAVT